MRLMTLLLATAGIAGGSTAANATFTVYTSESAFLAAVSAVGTDTYTGFSITGTTASPIVRTAGAYTYTATATPSPSGAGDGFYGAGTTANPWLSTNAADASVVFSGFTSGVSAIGGNFFTSNIAGAFAAGGITLTAVDASGSKTQTIANSATTSFLGFVSTGGLSSLTVTSIQPSPNFIWPTIDNLRLAKSAATPAVPEPATWALMILGFGAVGYAMRKRRVSYSGKQMA